MKRIALIGFLLCFLCNNLLQSQDASSTVDVKQLDVNTYEELVDGLDYSKTKRSVRVKKGKNKKLKDRGNSREKEKDTTIKSPSYSGPNLGGLFSILAYAVIIALIGILLYFIFVNIKIDKKIDKSAIDEEEEEIENIEEVDTNTKYQEALARRDYRSAIRWQFLDALKLLSIKEIISWKPEKTNRDYSREIKNVVLKNDFRQIARFYEQVWYGNNQIDQYTFEVLNVHFEKFIKNQNVK